MRRNIKKGNRFGLKIGSLILSRLSGLRFLWDIYLEMDGRQLGMHDSNVGHRAIPARVLRRHEVIASEFYSTRWLFHARWYSGEGQHEYCTDSQIGKIE